ncbi:MAG TPA: hypothetical protein VG900_03070 [Hyphomicrobiaceae bacterium]|jgi:hypothetical protein|nr:hypothetical protein [Hyphomicrobiaceae bacterium]
MASMERVSQHLRRAFAGARGWRREIIVALLLTIAAVAFIVGALVEHASPPTVISADKPQAR